MAQFHQGHRHPAHSAGEAGHVDGRRIRERRLGIEQEDGFQRGKRSGIHHRAHHARRVVVRSQVQEVGENTERIGDAPRSDEADRQRDGGGGGAIKLPQRAGERAIGKGATALRRCGADVGQLRRQRVRDHGVRCVIRPAILDGDGVNEVAVEPDRLGRGRGLHGEIRIRPETALQRGDIDGGVEGRVRGVRHDEGEGVARRAGRHRRGEGQDRIAAGREHAVEFRARQRTHVGMVDVEGLSSTVGDVRAVEVDAESINERGAYEHRILLRAEDHLEFNAVEALLHAELDVELGHVVVPEVLTARAGDGIQQCLLRRRGLNAKRGGQPVDGVVPALVILHIARAQHDARPRQVVGVGRRADGEQPAGGSRFILMRLEIHPRHLDARLARTRHRRSQRVRIGRRRDEQALRGRDVHRRDLRREIIRRVGIEFRGRHIHRIDERTERLRLHIDRHRGHAAVGQAAKAADHEGADVGAGTLRREGREEGGTRGQRVDDAYGIGRGNTSVRHHQRVGQRGAKRNRILRLKLVNIQVRSALHRGGGRSHRRREISHR